MADLNDIDATQPGSGQTGHRPKGYWHNDPAIESLYIIAEALYRSVVVVGFFAVCALVVALVALLVAATS